MEKFWIWLAGILPLKLSLYAALRVLGARRTPETWELDLDEKTLDLLRRWNEYAHERRVRWHSQNLSDGKRPMWEHGRAWLSTGRVRWRAEWCLLGQARHCGVEIEIGGEDDIQLSAGIPRLFNIWLTVGALFPYRWLPRDWHRSTGISVFEGYIWFNLWNDTSWGGRRKPWWQEQSINVPDLILGRSKHASETLSKTSALVTLPEGEYPVAVELTRDTWKRPRWPKTEVVLRAHVESEKGIPSHAGKGENSWDLDDDALFGLTCPAATVEEAVQKTAESILRDREKYGSPALQAASKA